MPCFKQLFHIGVWTFAWFVRPLLATILCVWEIWPGSNNHVYMYHVFHWLPETGDFFVCPKQIMCCPPSSDYEQFQIMNVPKLPRYNGKPQKSLVVSAHNGSPEIHCWAAIWPMTYWMRHWILDYVNRKKNSRVQISFSSRHLERSKFKNVQLFILKYLYRAKDFCYYYIDWVEYKMWNWKKTKDQPMSVLPADPMADVFF